MEVIRQFAIEKTKKRKQNKFTVFVLFGWKVWFSRRKKLSQFGIKAHLSAEIETIERQNYDRIILRLPVVGTTQQGSVG